MQYIGRVDCSGADSKGLGGPDVKMPSGDLTTHELLEYFNTDFGFDKEEVTVIMGEPSTEIDKIRTFLTRLTFIVDHVKPNVKARTLSVWPTGNTSAMVT